MDDSALYTGVDGTQDGVFGNETLEASTKELIDEQKRQLVELTPKLRDIIDMIDREIKSVMSVDRFISASAQKETDIRSELQAAALYKGYLDNLKTKFRLALEETKR